MSDSTGEASATPAVPSTSNGESETLNLIPQWLKRGPSASPRHAQAPPPPPSAAAPPADSRPMRGGGGSNKDRNSNSANDRPSGSSMSGGGRFQSFVQSEQQRRPPPQASSATSAAQGSFEGGRFTMPGEEGASGMRGAPPPRAGGAPARDFSSRGGPSSAGPSRVGGGPSVPSFASQQQPPPRVGKPAMSSSSAAGLGGSDPIVVPSSLPSGLRYYSRDELLDMASASALDSSLFNPDTPEGIVSADWQEPELRKQFDSEEIYNAWYESLQGERKSGGAGAGAGGGGGAGRQDPPRVDFRSGASAGANPPSWRGGPNKLDRSTFGSDAKGFASSILPPSGGMGLDKMAEAAKRFAEEMAQMNRAKQSVDAVTTPSKLQGLLGEPTGNAILDEPLEEGLDRPPEEIVIPEEEAIDYDGPAQAAGAPSTTSKRSSLPEVPLDPTDTRVQARQESRLLPKASLPPSTPTSLPQVPMSSSTSTGSTMLPQVPLDAFKQPSAQNSGAGGFGGATLPRIDAWTQPLGGVGGGAGGVQQAGGFGIDLLSPGGVFPTAKDYFKQPQQQQPPQGGSMPQRNVVAVPPQQQQPPRTPGAGGAIFVPVPPMPMMDEWFYKDPQSAIQGPFTSKEMKEWLEAGYFKPDLPISFGQHGTGKFSPLIHMFPDIRQAFQQPQQPPPPPPQQQQQRPMSVVVGQQQQPAVLPGVSLGPTIMPMGAQSFMQQQQQQQQLLRQQQEEQMQRQQRMLEQQHLEQQAWAMNRAVVEQQQQQQQRVPTSPAPKEHQQQPSMQQQQQFQQIAQQQQQQQQSSGQDESNKAPQQPSMSASKKPAAWFTASPAASPSTPTLQQIQAEEERLKKKPSSQPPSSGSASAVAPPTTPAKAQQQHAEQQPVAPAASPAVDNTKSNKPSSTPVSSNSASAAGTSTPWGKSAAEAVRAPTLKEIQEAEAEERKRTQQHQPVGTSMASHLAKAAGINPSSSGGGVWGGGSSSGGGAPLAAQEPVLPKKAAIPQSVLAPPVQQSKSSAPMAQAPAAKQQPAPAKAAAAPSAAAPAADSTSAKSKPAASSSSSSAAAAAEYSQGAMSGEMRSWCMENAPKIGADFTLLEFCYSIENSEEVRETFAGYLGMKPQVMSFVDEFLRRAGLDKSASTSGRSFSSTGGGARSAAADNAASSAAGGAKGSKAKKRG